MNRYTRAYLIENAPRLYQDYRADKWPDDEDRQCLHSAYDLLGLLDCGKFWDLETLAMYLAKSKHTISRYLSALQEAGLPIERSNKPNRVQSGRPTALFSLKDEEQSDG